MKTVSSARQRRYLAVWFPWLPSDRLRRNEKQEDGQLKAASPVVLTEKLKGALRLAAVSPAALKVGLSPGMTLADARARIPNLRAVSHQPEADGVLLEHLLDDFGRFSPMIALDLPHGLMLDVTGCDHLFGDEDGLIQAIQSRAERAGMQTKCALAGTPQAARALARFGPGGRFKSRQGRAAIRRLPVAALELSEREEQALRRAGLKTIGDLDDRPRAPLAARFGVDFPYQLDRILGDENVRITSFRAPVPVAFDKVFFEPISTPEDIERVIMELVREAADRLEQSSVGGRVFEVSFYRVDGHIRRIVVRAGLPTRDADAILRLFRERMSALDNPLDPGFGFDQIRLSVPWTQTLGATQPGFVHQEPHAEMFVHLVDRLMARLGPGAVLRLEPFNSHIPERAVRRAPATDRPSDEAWYALDPDNPPMRPLHMFNPPQPVETLAEVPEGYPLKFRWRRVLHEVTRAEGPERIHGEWWRAPDQRTRDYYRVEDQDGRRFWLFRQGLYGETLEPRWFIHGLFA